MWINLPFLQIGASSLHRQYFSEVLRTLRQKGLQLLRDVDTRWSSTLLMVERALLLREVSNIIIYFTVFYLNLAGNWRRPLKYLSETMTRTFQSLPNSSSVTQNGMRSQFSGISWRWVTSKTHYILKLTCFSRSRTLSNSNSLMRKHQPYAISFPHLKHWRQNGKSIR